MDDEMINHMFYLLAARIDVLEERIKSLENLPQHI